jgi:putative sporulation protein YtaF
MGLHIFSVILISISSNTDSFAVAIAYGIKQVRITIGANLLIAIVSSFGTFLSMSIGQIISGYLPHSIASMLGSGVLISIGILGMLQTIQQEWNRRKIEQYTQQESYSVSSFFHQSQSLALRDNNTHEKYIDNPLNKIRDRSRSIGIKQSIPLAFSLTLNNIGGGIGAGISGLNITLTTGLTFILAVLAIISGATLGGRIARRMTEFWAVLLSSTLIITIGIYEYFN